MVAASVCAYGFRKSWTASGNGRKSWTTVSGNRAEMCWKRGNGNKFSYITGNGYSGSTISGGNGGRKPCPRFPRFPVSATVSGNRGNAMKSNSYCRKSNTPATRSCILCNSILNGNGEGEAEMEISIPAALLRREAKHG